MYEDIKKNKIKTGVVVFAFLTMITLILYYLCYAFNFGEYAIVIALICKSKRSYERRGFRNY